MPAGHSLRPSPNWLDGSPAKMDEKFSAMYEADVRVGRPSISPGRQMHAMWLQVLFGIRGERQLVE